METLKKVIARVAACAAIKRKDADALQRHAKSAKLDQVILASWLADAGDMDAAIKTAQQAVKQGKGQVRPMAILIDLQWRNDDRDAAKKNLEKLRELATHADLQTPILARLQPVAKAAGLEGDWRKPLTSADDIGERPPLDELGPFRWQPYSAPTWRASLSDGTEVHSFEFDGRPRLVIFYLGFGCLHCIEQLHAFSPRAAEFDAAGIELIAISTETIDQLKTGMKDYDQPIAIPLMADPSHDAFKQFRCWDDFEDQPLHGTFLIDARGRVRWQDISHEPFTDVDFMLDEAKRLLELP
jgi:peroxiredoxin